MNNKQLFYWSCFPLHGLIWAESIDDAANNVTDRLVKRYPFYSHGEFDDVAVYPVYEDVNAEFQMFDS